MPLFFKWTVACAIVLLVIGVGYNFYQSRSEANLVYREVCAVRGEKLLVLLPDGSRVWLNADCYIGITPQALSNIRKRI